MLKVLELAGFKSFADKTRFVFPPAVTVVVGPNGSGKSNVVDAIKWVLGAQSVKSLRSKEMTDVIFNGSGARQPMNTAEVTLTFDNAQRLLPIDAPEIAVTRRVYRSGEGEYLLNGQACRLRDIRDLFAGTGVATEAYSVIEQGKVDVLLQSSPRDRRAIFEEAAGISRFKSKKLEAARRLDRVDQNLLRLSDIVDEVESRLRTVRLQASKARRYRDHSQRLQALRTQVGLVDWRALSRRIATEEDQLRELGAERESLIARLEAIDSDALQLETRIGEQDEAIRACEDRRSRNREAIASREASIEHERARLIELEDEARGYRRQVASMNTRAGGLQQQLQTTGDALVAAERSHQSMRERTVFEETRFRSVSEKLTARQQSHVQRRRRHMDVVREVAKLDNQIQSLASRGHAATEMLARCDQQQADLREEQAAVTEQLDDQQRRQQEIEGELDACASRLRERQEALVACRKRHAREQKELASLQGRVSGARERAAVLTELERRLEGVSAGVKQALVQARQAASGPYRQIRGLVADLLRVQVDTAVMVEVALGERAQFLVLGPGEELVRRLEQDGRAFPGRVGFLRSETPFPRCPVPPANLETDPRVMGRADRFVDVSEEYAPLVQRLLGQTYFVESLGDALSLAASCEPGWSFVTVAGELVRSEGSIVVGPRGSATRLISRRSELRALEDQIGQLQGKIDRRAVDLEKLEEEISRHEIEVGRFSDRHAGLSGMLGERRLRTASLEERREQLGRQQVTLAAQRQAATSQRDAALAQQEDARGRLAAMEAEFTDLETQLQEDARAIEELGEQRGQVQQTLTDRQVALGKSEQQLEGLRAQLLQFQRDHEERSRGLAELQEQLKVCQRRARDAARSILRFESEAAELYLNKERISVEVIDHRNRQERHRSRRAHAITAAREIRQTVRGLDKGVVQREMEIAQLQQQRRMLADRIREDYQIELAELEQEPSQEALRQREAVEREIVELRQKINNIGSVNLDALAELDELESRFASLSAQHADLEKAKGSLQQIIGRINADSRRLFADTLETVRGHFQSLFVKLFGGGHADIVLDSGDEIDPLESGIEIVARPPGKEPRSISLLSGGEKTLTCVALLLAIFRSRPSPFCVLDEVDAALDEANIERFAAVITEFLASTQFIVITHSKKTMTAANTLYGITMQESGVSKRVSVRFEDVHDDGHLRETATITSDAPAPSAAEGPDDDATWAA